jgi:signal transduction histidine kinase
MEPVSGVTQIHHIRVVSSLRPHARVVQVGLLLVPFALVLSTVLALSSNHVVHPLLTALFYGYSIAVPIGVAIYWWWRRPESRMGELLLLLGFAAAVSALQSANDALLYSIGVAGDAALTFMLFLVVLAFPRGRLETRGSRFLAGALTAVLALAFLPWLLASAQIHGGNPVFACQAACPANAFQVFTLPESTLLLLQNIGNALVALVAIGVLASFAARARLRPQAARRAAIGLAATSLILLPAIIVFVLGSVVLAPTDAMVQTAAVLMVGAVVLFPIGFAVPLVQADLDAAGAMRSLLHDLAADPSPTHWRDQLATMLDDPTVKVGYWRPGSARYVAADGLELGEHEIVARHLIPIQMGNDPLAAIALDPAVDVEPELERAVAKATAVAVANDQVRDIRADLAIRASGAAGYERERMAREIQAGTQQRLAAMRVQLRLVADGDDGNTKLAEVGRDLDAAIRELRDVVWTAEPAVVTRGGLGRALRGVGHRAPLPIRILDSELHRHTADAELAVYYCCVEAIQNAVKHAGPSATVTIRLADAHPDGIRFSVADDGRGFEPAADHRGHGLENMHERVTALDGQVTVARGRNGGTVVTGSVRDTPPAAWVAERHSGRAG